MDEEEAEEGLLMHKVLPRGLTSIIKLRLRNKADTERVRVRIYIYTTRERQLRCQLHRRSWWFAEVDSKMKRDNVYVDNIC